MRYARGLVLIGAAAALAGCGASANEQVQAKLQEFTHAVAGHDAHTLCRHVLAPALVAHFSAAGLDCQQAMQTYFESVSDPTLSTSKVTVHGSRASAVVLTSAKGQPSAVESVQLVRTRDGWRLASLATPR
jgi:ketosteroid isomerase-like protein